MKIIYTGTADFKEFGAADFKKAEVEGKKVVFRRGEVTEVDDAIGEALTSNEGIFGDDEFKEVEDEENEAELELELNDEQPQPAPKKKVKAKQSGPGATTQQGTADAGSATTGARSTSPAGS